MSKVVQLKQATTYAGLSDRVEEEIERAYWVMLNRLASDPSIGDRYAFKHAVRDLFLRLRMDDPPP